MSGVDSASGTGRQSVPSDVIVERLNDPAVAASLATLLDNAELLSTLVLGLSGFMERGDYVMDVVAEGVRDLKVAGGSSNLPSMSELGEVAGELAAGAPVIRQIMASPITDPETIDVLSTVAEAATEGMERARLNDTRIDGIRSLFATLRDDDVQRGLGVVVEIARSLGRRFP